MIIGVLSLQGCVDPHVRHLESLGIATKSVRLEADFAGIDGLILPGGESTTMLRLIHTFKLWDLLKESADKIPFWGICAGAILMAKKVENPSQESLGIMDISVRRNAYGRQLESSQSQVVMGSIKEDAVFIRAPKFLEIHSSVKIEGIADEEPVFLSQERHMVTAFHPELTESNWCHKLFLEKIISHNN